MQFQHQHSGFPWLAAGLPSALTTVNQGLRFWGTKCPVLLGAQPGLLISIPTPKKEERSCCALGCAEQCFIMLHKNSLK